VYLKSLEMVGFKSFADRTKLDFEPGMMAIVGPNGCGKSNVSDAIRWVLGEQSAKALRGGAMTDVIFNGTDGVRPQNMAEVSLTLADCESALGTDYHEVTVTRRVFRSGEGQYLLNKTPCRLKDIQRLFMDTGLGTNSYSVMEQGRIDQILSSRPDDRREVFEEASGISKYKADKKEALRKLEHTEANLLRLGDIIKEVRRQMISLQRQVGKAKRYKSLQEELRALDLWLGRTHLEAADSRISALQADHAALAEAEEALRRRLAADEERASAARDALADLESRIAAAMDAANEAETARARAADTARGNRERAAELETLSQRDARESESAAAALATHRAELDRLAAESESAAAAVRAAEDAARDRQSGLAAHDARLAAARDALSALRAEAASQERLAARAQSEWDALETRTRDALLRRERAAAEKAGAERAADAYSAALSDADARRKARAADIQSATDSLAALRESRAALRNRIAETQQSAARTAAQIAAREAQVALLDKSRAEARGYPEGTKKLLSKTPVPGVDPAAVLGPLAAKIRAPKPHQTALQAALRASLDAVLVASPSSALAIARALSAAHAGATRLLPVSGDAASSRVGGPGAKPPPLPGATPLLPSLRAPASLAPLLTRLLGNVCVLPADSFPDPLPPGLTLVSPDGIVARADGQIELWAPEEGESNPLALEEQLAEWREDLDRLRAEADTAKTAVSALQTEDQTASDAIAKATSALDAHRRELALAEGEWRMAEREEKAARRRADDCARELAALDAENAAAETRRAAIRERLAQAQAALASLRDRATADSEALRHLEESRTALLEASTEARVALSGARQAADALRAQAAPLTARVAELETLIRERSAGVDSYRARIAELLAGAADAESRLAPLAEAAETRRRELSDARAERERAQTALATGNAALQDTRAELDKTRDRRVDAGIQLDRQNVRRQSLLDRLAADYGAAEPEIRSAPAPSNLPPASESSPSDKSPAPAAPSAEILETMAADLRSRIAAMGPVNLVAIEEHQELEERYAFLSQQNDDLSKAKNELTALIRNINDTTTSLFADTFKKVNENFQELFKQLFGGGSARLVLVDEANVLESGIEIVARPPGKKPQSVSLLSGGERTLTAVSLLFALFRVKPSAFCLTDELDAALDDHNISRYLDMLAGFLKDTQFLVITHNRQTIARADALYGVTMERRGISKFVTMKFRGDKTTDTPDGSTGAPARPDPAENKP
jgi:chromosome segregation protein